MSDFWIPLNVFLQLNVLIAVSFFGASMLRRLRGLGQGLSQRALLRVQRTLLLSAVACPLAVAALPREASRQMASATAESSASGDLEAGKSARDLTLPFEGGAARAALQLPGASPSLSTVLSLRAAFVFERATSTIRALVPVLILLWLAGAFAMAILFARGALVLRATLRVSLPWRKVGRVDVRLSPAVTVPFAFSGFGRRYVVLAESLVLTPSWFKDSLRHELQHHRHQDPLWSLGLAMVAPFLWFNPFFSAWRHALRESEELACDEALVKEGRVEITAYASMLVEFSRVALGRAPFGRGRPLSLTMASSPSRTLLGRRIVSMNQISRHPRVAFRALMVSVSLFTAASMGGFAWKARAETLVSSASAVTASKQPHHNLNAEALGSEPENDRLREALRASLRAAGTFGKPESGWAMVADVATGSIRISQGFVAPPNRAAEPEWKDESWILAQRFTPASMMKPLVASVLLQRKAATLEDPLPCRGDSYSIGGNRYREWKKGGFTRLSLRQAVAQSSNVCILEAANRLGPQELRLGLADLGLPHLTEHIEEVPDALARFATGLGIELSPLDFLSAYARLAGSPSRAIGAPTLRADVTTAFRKMLRDCVTEGTCRDAATPLAEVGGKTGTALARGNQEPSLVRKPRTIASFVGLVPTKTTEALVLVVLTQKDDRALAGGKLAAPVFRQIAESIVTLP